MRCADFRPGDPSAQRIRIGIHLDRQGDEHDAIVELLRASRQWGCTLLGYLGTPPWKSLSLLRCVRPGVVQVRVRGRLPHQSSSAPP